LRRSPAGYGLVTEKGRFASGHVLRLYRRRR